MTPAHRDPLDDPLDQHLDALGVSLDQGVARAERGRRRRLRGIGATGVLAAIGLGALVALPGGRTLDPVAEARAAVAEGDGILHFIVRSEFIGPHSRLPKDPAATEVWTAISGTDRYRMRTPADGRPRFCGMATYMVGGPRPARRLTGPVLTAPSDFAQDGETSTSYSPWSRAAVVITDRARPPRQAMGVGIGTPRFGLADPRDPVRAIRAALQRGALRDGGTVVRDGRSLRRLVGSAGPTIAEAQRLQEGDARARSRWRRAQNEAGRELSPTRYAYLVDADDFAPVELRTRRYGVWSRAGGYDHWKWTTAIDRFETFDRLANTPANERLLAVPLPAGTKVYRLEAGKGVVPALGFGRAARREQAAIRRCRAAMR